MPTAPRVYGITVPSRKGMEFVARGIGQRLQQGKREEKNTCGCLCVIKDSIFVHLKLAWCTRTDTGTNRGDK